MYAVGCEVYYHPPFLLIGLHSIEYKCKLINFNQYNLLDTGQTSLDGDQLVAKASADTEKHNI
jgi:hypothetical protein